MSAPDGSGSPPEIEAIMQAAEAAHERFIAESRAMDQAWANGVLDEWLAEKLAAEKRGDTDGDSGASDGGSGDGSSG